MRVELNNRVAWVIGGTGTLGASVAAALADNGASVVVSSRRRPVGEMPKAGPHHVVCDLMTDEGVLTGAAEIVARYGRIDILVNCVTQPVFGPFSQVTDEEWVALTQVKYLGYVRSMRAVLPHMVAQKGGCIVNISGGSAKQPTENHAAGAAANAAVNAVSKALSNGYGQHGIRINVVAPGQIRSARLNAMVTAGAADAAKIAPLGHAGEPEDVAAAVLFLVSNAAKYVTGSLLAVDGGGVASL